MNEPSLKSNGVNKNSYLNAVLAEAYIILIVLFIQHVLPKGPDNGTLTPIAVLSLFVLSAAIMGYLFLAKSVQLFLDGHKQQAVNFFLKTLATFAGITVVVFIVLSIVLAGRK